VVLDAIASLSNYENHTKVQPNEIMSHLLKEAEKSNLIYVLHAVTALEKSSRGRNDEFFHSFTKFLKDKLSIEELKFEEDVKLEQKRNDQKTFFETRRIIVKCMSKILPQNEKEGIEFYFSFILDQSQKVILFSERIEMMKVLLNFLKSDLNEKIIELGILTLLENMEYSKPNEGIFFFCKFLVKLFSVDVLNQFLERKDCSFFNGILRKHIETLIENEKDKNVSENFLKFLK
jgi:hypothetical protein